MDETEDDKRKTAGSNDLSPNDASPADMKPKELEETVSKLNFLRDEGIVLLEKFGAISDANVRSAIIALVKTFADCEARNPRF